MSYHRRLLALYYGSLAPRTYHIKAYLQFCARHQVSPFSPGVYDVLSFLLFLTSFLKSPGAALNYFSSIKLWLSSCFEGKSPFDAPEVKTLKKGLVKVSPHIVVQASPIVSVDLKRIIQFLASSRPVPRVSIASFIIAYLTLLMQSDLLSSASGPGPHMLLARVVNLHDNKLYITVRSSKTWSHIECPLMYALSTIPRSSCCPVTAWSSYSAHARPPPAGLAFLQPSGQPLTSAFLKTTLHATAVQELGRHRKVTLHSLRRGAAQACQSTGLHLAGLLRAGTWHGTGVRSYLLCVPCQRSLYCWVSADFGSYLTAHSSTVYCLACV